MWVISIAAEIGPITPATIERCNYSATNDKKKKERRGMEEQKVVQRKKWEGKGREEEREEKRNFDRWKN